MVGRDEELRAVEQALAGARAGNGGAVFVVGEAGIGKSRLAAAATDLGFACEMSIMRGRGTSIGPMAPFRPLTEALMSWVRAGRLVDAEALGPYRPVLARLIPDLGPAGTEQEPGALTILAEAVLRLTALAGQNRGCLLVLDDLQDADAETLSVVEYLADNLSRQPAVLLGTLRGDPGPALDLARSAAQRGSGSLLELRRLGGQEVRQMAASCLESEAGEIPPHVAEDLRETSGGIPLLVEELLGGMLRSGALARGARGWQVAGAPRAAVPTTLARAMAGRLELIGPRARAMLSVAAVLGQRFPLAVLQEATSMDDRELLGNLHSEIVAQIVVPDDQMPDWYGFRHPLMAEALLALAAPGERRQLAGQAAGAVEAVFGGLPGEWCQAAATLWLQAGEASRAGRLFAEAGRRAAAQGAADSAVMLLDKALDLLTGEPDMQARADAFASLLSALAEAGLVERALTSAGELEKAGSLLSRQSRAHLHTRVAWAAVVAGRPGDGLAQVDIARRLLGPDAPDRDAAAIDVVEAHLMLDLPGPGQMAAAEALARRAAQVAESADLPVVACQAWQLLGAVSRSRDPDEATACLERARQTAVRRHLPIEEIHALIRLGNDDALRDGRLDRLEQARREATRVGAVTTRYQAEASIALQQILRAEFAEAEALLDQLLPSTIRLKLVETTQYALLLRAILRAHQGRRRDMDAALADLRRWRGDHAQHLPRLLGLARAWCSLLEENRGRARKELSAALAAEEQSPSIFQLTGRYGLHLLLGVLAGEAGRAEHAAVTAAPVSRLRWDRHFALLADAVLLGREGKPGEAVLAVEQAGRLGAPYATARQFGLRLVSEAAMDDGWADPVGWLRAAEEYFHQGGVPAVASACRALMRRAGVSVGQRRQGLEELPPALRAAGVTVREYEVLRLLIHRLSNREIASRLHLSPRTVEKHVASLIAKTGQPDRVALGEYGSAALT